MKFTIDFDGVSTPVTLEDIESYRSLLIELRNSALDVPDFDRAVGLTHVIAFLHEVKKHVE